MIEIKVHSIQIKDKVHEIPEEVHNLILQLGSECDTYAMFAPFEHTEVSEVPKFELLEPGTLIPKSEKLSEEGAKRVIKQYKASKIKKS